MNEQKLQRKIDSDLATVKENALGIIIISPDNKSFELVRNENGRLGVLAIIGPSRAFGQDFQESLLAEIGIGPTRPYHEAFGLNRQPNQSNVHQRGKYFCLTAGQYDLVAPTVFDFITRIAQETMAGWKHRPFILQVLTRRAWSHKHKTIFEKESWIEISDGKRFAISKKDIFLLRDIYWAELNLNPVIIHKLSSIARFIDKRTDFYRRYGHYKWKRPFEKIKVRSDIEKSVIGPKGDFPLYLKEEIFKRLPRGQKTMFYEEIKKLFGLDGLSAPEQRLAQQATELGNPKQRLGEIQLFVTTGLNGVNRRGEIQETNRVKDYIVFEVHPPSTKKIDQEDFLVYPLHRPEKATELSDDIPF